MTQTQTQIRSPARKFQTHMPTYAQWERLSGGQANRTVPLIRYIDKKMYEHSILARYVQQFDKMNDERYACLIQLWNATRMYMKANATGFGTFGRNRRSPTRADGFRKVHLPGGETHNRSDAVGALQTLVTRDLMDLTGAASEPALKAHIKRSALCELTADGIKADYTRGERTATYLTHDERAAHRVIFEHGVALMHPRNQSLNPLDWVPAHTCDRDQCSDSFRNPCYQEIAGMLSDADQGQIVPFEVGNEEAKAYWRRVRPRLEFGIEGYVMTHGRKFFMSPEHKNGEFFHSAYTAGEGVACSGSVTFIEGVPTMLSNASGHYKPTPDKLNRVVSLFEMAGLPLDRLNLVVVQPDKNHHFYTSVADFRKSLRRH